ncbi:hypothetical protein [Sphingomonas sp. S2-65]|uniref:hypothetical protein n=1 Tax=Sphingomonas sp. S2-65 TaxID=2903960 RepID=UPI001F308F69|nr:hypothetical protein [Sphingomonas sp. S2-65]UYY60121.1 hypothetical protein LZ586_08600 [Sphingomonas sp. S2-65]
MSYLWPNLWPTLSAPLAEPKLRVLSLGAGVQSTVLALASSGGDVGPLPDCAIFADTQWEPRKVRKHLAWLRTQLRFPVFDVTAGSIRQSIFDRRNTTGGRFAAVPWFIRNPDGTAGMGRRQCTKEYKLAPITKKIRELVGAPGRERIVPGSVEVWVGISTDEIERMKPARQLFLRNRWPLIEAGMSRRDCERWLAERQWSAPKSSCIGCPFHSNAMWRDMRDNEPEDWADACEMDRQLRLGSNGKMRGEEYMHPSLMPLSEAPIDEADSDQLGFQLECEGMCGV